MRKPPCIKTGDKVAIVSLSSGILGEEGCRHQVDLGIKRLKEFGLEVVFMRNTLKGSAFLHNHPEARAEDLIEAYLDDSIKAIICAIGGDDTFRLLPFLIHHKPLLQAIQKSPKIFTGFSDTTNNHLFFTHLGVVSFYGPNFLSDLAELEPEILPYTKAAFQTYFGQRVPYEITPSSIWYEERTDYSASALNTKRVRHLEERGFMRLFGHGQVVGELLGGCLESLYDAYTGSRYPEQLVLYHSLGFLPKVEDYRGKIWFIETSEETPSPEEFRRYLAYFEEAGIYEMVSAILVGKPQNEKYFEEYKNLLIEFSTRNQIPTLMNLNFGHSTPRMVLPYGVKARVDFEQCRLWIIESPYQE